MAQILTAPPAVEPVSLAEAKAHLKIDGGDEDAILSRLITAARLTVERMGGLALITQGWSLYRDRWPAGPGIELTIAPVASIEALNVYGEDDVAATIDPAHYYADLASDPPRLIRRSGRQWPQPGRCANGIEIEIIAGFGDDPADVPEPLRQAVLMLAAHWFEHRAAVEDEGRLAPVPVGVQALVAPYRRIRL